MFSHVVIVGEKVAQYELGPQLSFVPVIKLYKDKTEDMGEKCVLF